MPRPVIFMLALSLSLLFLTAVAAQAEDSPSEDRADVCIPEAVAGLLWRPPMTNLPCSKVFETLRDDLQRTNNTTHLLSAIAHPVTAGTIRRTCSNGTWSDVDYSRCLINSDEAFVLLWIPLNTSDPAQVMAAVPAIRQDLYQMLDLNSTFDLSFVRSIELGQPTKYISATFVLKLPTKTPSPETIAHLETKTDNFGNGVMMIGGLLVFLDVSWGIQGFYEADSCYCTQPTDTLFLGLCQEIVPVPACTMNGTLGNFECFFPYFIGDGLKCTVDEDGDGFPNIPLEICTQLGDTDKTFCTADNCPSHYNPDQDVTKCMAPPEFTGCEMAQDEMWEVFWGNTALGETDTQRCPRGPGFTTRFCGPNGWEPAVLTMCGTYEYRDVWLEALDIFDDDDVDIENKLTNSMEFFEQIRTLTKPGRRRVSIFPFDLEATNRLVNVLLELLEEVQEQELNITIPQFNFADILSNILTSTNLNGWVSLQDVQAGSREVLDISERYGLYLSRTVGDNDNDRRLYQRDNLIINYKNANPDLDGDQMFPESDDDINGTFTSIPAQIMIPRSFLSEQMGPNRNSVPVSTILYRNMEMALPSRPQTDVASMVLSAQVSQRGVFNAPSLQTNPIVMKFEFDAVENATDYFCAFWEFSDPVGSGSWRTSGVSMMSKEISDDGQKVTVHCNATHLTSFAVLVDLSGTLNPGDNNTGVDQDELLALQIVSYVGCAISLLCLLATIIFFLVMGKELFQKVHYFIHLNLAIVLFLAYLMFVVGIEPAKANKGACVFVAAWLHYFFLTSFSWMLCEGIMLYLMLVVVFSKMSKKWWFFLIIGYGLPVIPVAVTLGVRVDQYGVYGADGSLRFCWLSTTNGVIWGFVGPMLAIIMVNLVFLVIALATVFKTTHRTVKRSRTAKGKKSQKENMDIKEKHTLFKKLLLAMLVLLPLLGVTWVLGIFTVNANTTVFAWLFTIFNSLQGMFIFFFHVLRSDKVWQNPRAKSVRSTLSKRLTSTSLGVSTVSKHFSLQRTDTTTSILNDNFSSNGKYDSKSDGYSLPEIAEEAEECPAADSQNQEPCEGESGKEQIVQDKKTAEDHSDKKLLMQDNENKEDHSPV